MWWEQVWHRSEHINVIATCFILPMMWAGVSHYFGDTTLPRRSFMVETCSERFRLISGHERAFEACRINPAWRRWQEAAHPRNTPARLLDEPAWKSSGQRRREIFSVRGMRTSLSATINPEPGFTPVSGALAL